MARIILAGYMFRYPLGGMLSNTLQYLIGLVKLGHDVFFIEKSAYENSCFDPERNIMSSKCSYGIKHVAGLLTRFSLGDRWCYCDFEGDYSGLDKEKVEELFKTADLFIDYGAHGTWNDEACMTNMKVLIDGEPGTTQMKMCLRQKNGETCPEYDYFYTVGQCIGESHCTVPQAGRQWRKIFHPVDTSQFAEVPVKDHGAFTTVMNWQSRENLEFKGVVYGHKDMEFENFLSLPARRVGTFEVAVAGSSIPQEQLKENHWQLRNAHYVTRSYDIFTDYIKDSKGEFSVCKNTFVATRCGWFSDRSAVYLACGKPVVLQETGFSDHLPCGRGLFAVRTADEAAEAIEEINNDYKRHSRSAHEIAVEYLDAPRVLRRFLDELGI